MMRSSISALTLVLLLLQSPFGKANESFDFAKLRFPVSKTVLPNGLTILLHEDHSVPTVSYQMWFRVGSKYEDPGYTGLAHLFEHMMFKGGKRYDGKVFTQLLLANGVTYNAFTTYDYTGYYEDLPPHALDLILDIESDRVENLALNQENFQSEREVVKEERRMRVDNSIPGILNEVLWSNAYQVHPYKWPVIGWMKDLDNISLERAKEFFHTYYSVSNAVICIVGDVNEGKVLELIKKYFGGLPKVDIPPKTFAQEPPQKAEKKIIIKKPVQAESIDIGYHITKAGEEDSYVLDLVSNMLSEGESSRLFKRLVFKEQLATEADTSSNTPQDPGLFEVFVQLKPKVKHERVLPIIYSELTKVANISQKELDKSKNQVMKHWVDGMKTIHKKAYSLILNEIVTGSYENLFKDLERYQKVTVSDVRRVVKKYFIPSNRTVVSIIPEKGANQ